MKKTFSLIITILFLLFTVGCSSDSTDTTPTENTPENLIDPSGIDFGYDEEKDEYDRWYLKGSDDVIYLYFFSDEESDTITYNIVKSGVVKESSPLSVTNEYHLVSDSADFGFEDNFNVYNFKTNEWYSRGNADEYNANFSEKTFSTEDGSKTLTFNTDFSCSLNSKKETAQGSWEVMSKNTLRCTFENETIDYKVEYNEDFLVNSLSFEDDIFYNTISEDETINKYKAY